MFNPQNFRPIPPNNFGISRELAVAVSVVGVATAIIVLVIFISVYGLSDRTTPVIVTLAGALATAIPSLVSSLKSTEAADTAAKTKHVAEFTASQNAAL